MRVLGIDPGLITTGFGVVEISGHSPLVIDAGTVQPRQGDVFAARIAKVHECVSAIIAQHQPDIMVLEKLYAHYKHPTTASILGHVRGVICLAANQQGLSIEEHSVKRIRKALLGNGNATKQQVAAFIKRVLNLPDVKMALDTSDALALALGYAHMKRYQLL